jgi:hypothetical protein
MRIHCWQGRIASSTNQLWPCLSPFGLRSVLAIVLQTAPHLRLRSLLVRKMLAAYTPQLAAFPLDRGYPALPATWGNFYRFWPLPVYFGKRVFAKMARVIRSNEAASIAQGSVLSLRLQLWREEAVHEILCHETKKLETIVEKSALDDFLSRSQQQRFPYDAQWRRLLSLQAALSVLEKSETAIKTKGTTLNDTPRVSLPTTGGVFR